MLIAFIQRYSPLLSRLTAHACDSTWVNSFLYYSSVFLNINLGGILTLLQHWYGWCHMKLLLLWHVLCTPYNHAPCHFIQSHIHKVHACLAVMCHLPFRQNDLDLLHAIAVTWGVEWIPKYESAQKVDPGDRHSSAWTMQGFKPVTFQSWVRHSNHWLTELSSLTTAPTTLV